MEIPHKIGNEIVNYNPRCTYCPLVPKRDTFYATDGTPLLIPSPQSAKAHLQWFSSLNMTNYGVTNESLVLDI